MNDPQEKMLAVRLRTMQIVAGAQLMGVGIFLAIVLYLVLGQRQGVGIAQPGNQPILSLVAVGMLAVAAPLSFFVPAAVERKAVGKIAAGTWTWQPRINMPVPDSDAEKLLIVRQTALIIGLALLEGTCFFGCIAYLLEANVLSLAVVAVGMSLQLLKFPTDMRVRNWLTEQMEQLAQARQERAG